MFTSLMRVPGDSINPYDIWPFGDIRVRDVSSRRENVRVRKLDGGGHEISMALPGMKREDVEVSIDGSALKVTAETKDEGFVQSFKRTWSLSDDHDRDGIKASMIDGVLTITVPIAEGRKPRVIDVS